VGRLIGHQYALFYEVPEESVRAAAVLRAEAGALRDAGGAAAGWQEVARLLRRSYRSLHEAIATP
jgi:hypothetical protein